MFTEDQRKRLIDALTTRIGKDGRCLRCPMCDNKDFALGEGHFSPVVQNTPGAVKLAGRTLPTTYIICRHCGFVSQHALGVLGLMDMTRAVPKKEGEKASADPKEGGAK